MQQSRPPRLQVRKAACEGESALPPLPAPSPLARAKRGCQDKSFVLCVDADAWRLSRLLGFPQPAFLREQANSCEESVRCCRVNFIATSFHSHSQFYTHFNLTEAKAKSLPLVQRLPFLPRAVALLASDSADIAGEARRVGSLRGRSLQNSSKGGFSAQSGAAACQGVSAVAGRANSPRAARQLLCDFGGPVLAVDFSKT